MSTIREHPIDTKQRFLSRWPFFGPWFIAFFELAQEWNVQIDSLSVPRTHYLNFLEPAEALSHLTGGHQP